MRTPPPPPHSQAGSALGVVVWLSALELSSCKSPVHLLVRIRDVVIQNYLHRYAVVLDLRGIHGYSPIIADPLQLGDLFNASGAKRGLILVDHIGTLIQCSFGIRLTDPVLLLNTRTDPRWVETALSWTGSDAASVPR